MKIEVKSTVTTDQSCMKLIEDMARVYLERCYGKQGEPLLTKIFGKEKVAEDVRKILEALAANTIPTDPHDLVEQAEQELAKRAASEQTPEPLTETAEPKPKQKSKSKAGETAPTAEEQKTTEEQPPPPACPHCGKTRVEHKATAARAHVWQCASPGCKLQFTTPKQQPAEQAGAPDGTDELVERRTAFCKNCGDPLELLGYDKQDANTGIWQCSACGDANMRLSRYISAAEAEQTTA